jgi:hypothetical protein
MGKVEEEEGCAFPERFMDDVPGTLCRADFRLSLPGQRSAPPLFRGTQTVPMLTGTAKCQAGHHQPFDESLSKIER